MRALLLALCLSLPASAGTFSGRWATTYGDMTLETSTAGVRGSYDNNGDPCRIEGRLTGQTLAFTYTEPESAGEGRFSLSEDGQSFDGRWRARGERAWNPWKGVRRDAAEEELDFSGVWDSTFGRLRLSESSGAVTGLYASPGGTLTGSAQGGSAHLRYQDSAAGEADFTLSADSSAFSGRWRQDGEKEWQPWTGSRVQPVSGRRWLYILESRWEEGLSDREYSYGDTLKAFFARLSNVQVRQRAFNDPASLLRWLREAAFLAEPVLIYISSHGTQEGVYTDTGIIGAEPLAAALRTAPNVELLHFGSCEVMKGEVPGEIQRLLGPGARFPISGFTEEVDWAGSAVTDLVYLDLILSQDYEPARAARETARLLPFSAKTMKDSPFGALGFRFKE